MKSKVTLGLRVLLGLVFFAAGITGLLHLVPMPTDLPDRMVLFNQGMEASGYLMTLVKLTETIAGLLLISGFFVPLALVMLAPVVLNIFFVNALMMPSGLPLALIIGLILVYLAFFAEPYKRTIRSLFKAK